MKKILFIFSALAVLMLASCLDEEKSNTVSESTENLSVTAAESAENETETYETEEITVTEEEPEAVSETEDLPPEEKKEEKKESEKEPEKKPEKEPEKESVKSKAAFLPICEEYISLRKTARSVGTVVCKILKGQEMTVVGYEGVFAKVQYKGKTGYVNTKFITPKYPELFTFDTVKKVANYTYDDMKKSIAALKESYPMLVDSAIIGKTEEGRDIPVITIGNPAGKKVLIQCSMHAREYMNTWLIMVLCEEVLKSGASYLNDVCFHIIPMVNPDGVIISQTGKLGAVQKEIFIADKARSQALDLTLLSEEERKAFISEVMADGALYNAAKAWKANALGIDLNRNFPDGWEELKDFKKSPSAEYYAGEAPFSAKESAAIRDYTLKYNFSATVSFHCSGDVIYYDYGTNKDVISKSKELANKIRTATGYIIDVPDKDASGAGYKDYAQQSLAIPSVTVEVGNGNCPLETSQYYIAYLRNVAVLSAIAAFVK